MKLRTALSPILVALSLTGIASAQNVDVKGAWARATVQGQKATGAFMTLTSKTNAKLVGATSSVAGVTEVHEMKMDNGVMKMKAVEGGLELPAGKATSLKPGGYHVMLMDLKLPLQKDTTIPLTLVFKDAKGVESKMELKVPVAQTAPGGGADMGGHQHGDMANKPKQ